MSEEFENDLSKREIDRILDRATDIVSNKAQDGIRMVEFKEDGVYLTVYPPQHGGRPVIAEELVKDIEAQKIQRYDFVKIQQAAREMGGHPVLIAPPQSELIQDGSVMIELSRNKMEAYLTVYPPRGGKSVTRQEIEDAIKVKNIVYGLQDDIIDKALSLQDVSEPLVIARGCDPIDGENAKIDFRFENSVAGKPAELLNGKVDFYNLNLIKNVDAGTVLAIKTLPTPGTPGYTVTGEELPAKPGKDVQLSAGKNAELIDDNTAVIANTAGHVVISGNKISVSSVYEVKGDVDFSTGNVEFNGSVIVKGSIREGFTVRAEGDVEVMDTIADGIVGCTGNLKVKSGIVGKKTVIKAGGSVYTRFIENAHVESGGDIVVGEAIMHSKVSAKKSVTVGGKGVIVGGVIRAGEEISCNIVGSHLATVTELEAGVNPELRQQYSRLVKDKQDREIDLDKAEKAIKLLTHLQKTQGQLSQDKLAILVRVARAQAQMKQELENLQENVQNLEFQLQQSERGKIKVQGLIHPGVKVTIGSASTQIRDDVKFACLTRVGSDIKINSYK